jgi:hypothetical protein
MSVGPIAPPASGIGAAGPSASASGQTPLATPPAAATTAATAAIAAPADAALNALVLEAISAQDSLAPLLADLTAAVQSDALPAAARTTAQQILAAQTPLDANVTSADLRAAVSGSGLFLEAILAAVSLAPAGAGGAAPDLSGDLKALLSQLAQDLTPQAETAALEVAAAQAPPARTDRTTSAARGSATRPPPPASGAATSAQPATQTSLDAHSDLTSLSRALRQDAQAALARLQLSQIASLPKSGAPARWSFELPVAAPQGHAMAQFEISRDGRGSGAGAAPGADPTWRAKFSINVEPGGPVHAEVTLSSGRTRVTLWGERDSARQALSAHQNELERELAGPEGGDAAVRVLSGAPNPPPVEAGRLVNRTS